MKEMNELDTIIEAAVKAVKKSKSEITVIHAPIENAEEQSKYGYCPTHALSILYAFALKGMGQENEPCQGIMAIVSPKGSVFKTENGLKIV